MAARLLNQSAVAWHAPDADPAARLLNQSAVAWQVATETPIARLFVQSAIVWHIEPEAVGENAEATDTVSASVGVSNLWWDASNQLVISDTQPPGSTPVSDPVSFALIDASPWYRLLDTHDGSSTWHPANYYGGAGDAAGTISGYLSRPSVLLPADAFGNVTDYAEASGQFVVRLNGADISASCTFAAENPIDLVADIDAAGAYAATELTADVGSIAFTAEYKGQSLTFVFTVSRAAAGMVGDSVRRAYSKTTLASLSPTPETITTSGSSSFPPNDSWGDGTVWQGTAPAIVAGESLYISDAVYSEATDETVWNVPYLGSLKVGQLSALAVNTGSLVVDESISIGQESFDDGSGIWAGLDGGTPKLSIGNSEKAMVWDGDQLQVRGDIIATGNIMTGAISEMPTAILDTPTAVPSGSSWTTVTGTAELPAVTDASERGNVLFLFSLYLQSGNSVNVKWNIKVQYSTNGGSSWADTGVAWTFRLVVDGTGDFYGFSPIGFFSGVAGSTANAVQFRLQAYHSSGVTKDVGSATDGYCQLTLLELKR
jgi:hypothetical protein